MTTPDGLLQRPVRTARVVGCAIVSIVAALCAGSLVMLAALFRAGPTIEGMPAVMTSFVSLWFAIPGVIGGAVCLGWSGRVYDSARARAAAFTASWVALVLSILATTSAVLVVVLP
ncbi:hypothetical protein [Microbacterium sp. NPDC058389]|uniref:hypothetical protein n=1 Tax=Microbacterium sp. NPDC058389 TaxID=3346475 RepID=UPI00365A9C28